MLGCWTVPRGSASQDVITGTSYGPAGELLTMSGTVNESRGYNSLLQLTSVNAITYNYPATQNNGKIQSQTDAVSGEQITYTYDSLLRLASATSNQAWSQSFGYDGFGNLTDVNGTHTDFSWANNRPIGAVADLNGNNTAVGTYDVENRLKLGGGVNYGYAPDNKRVWRGVPNSLNEFTLWGVNGQKLATFNVGGSPQSLVSSPSTTNVWFGGRLALKNGNAVSVDNLGSRGKYYPYGGERGSSNPASGQEKFATYTRDMETGLDYADQRYYQPGTGMFLSPDPWMGSAHSTNPASWNRYAYVTGDPINGVDPLGLGSEDGPSPGYCDLNPLDSDCRFGNSGPIGKPGSAFPACNASFNKLKENHLQFLVDHYSEAAEVADANDIPVDWILGWSAVESGSYHYPDGTYWGTVKQAGWQDNSFFGQTGKGWDSQVSCPIPVTNSVGQTYACFESFETSAIAALTSFNGLYGSALKFAAAAGASANAAFYEVAGLGYFADPVAYGKTIQGAISGNTFNIDDLLKCLKKYDYIE